MNSIVLDNLTVAVMAIDQNFKITVANKMCKTILEIEPKDAIGVQIDEFFGYPPEFTRTVQHTLEQGKDFRYDIFPYTWGKYEKTLSQRSTLLKNEKGETVGAMIEFEDITERHKLNEEYRVFMEENSINIIPIDQGIGMIVMQALPFEVDPGRFADLGARAMKKAVEMKVQQLVLDASSFPAVRLVDNIGGFKGIVGGFKMLGIEVVVAGIRPEVAVQVIQAGAHMNNFKTFAHTNQAINYLKNRK